MYIEKELSVEIEDTEFGGLIVADVQVDAQEVDASFSHEFGVKREAGIEIEDVHILDVWVDDEHLGGVGMDAAIAAYRELIEDKAAQALIEAWQDNNI